MMSNFFSHLEINSQVGQNDDEEDQEKEDVAREKEIKELLANELNDDDLFEDDNSFTSHQTSGSAFDTPIDSFNQFYTFPSGNANELRPAFPAQGPLVTSRGAEFLSRRGPEDQRNGRQNEEKNHQNYDENNGIHLNAHSNARDQASEFETWKEKSASGNWVYDRYHQHYDENGYDCRSDSFRDHFSSNKTDASFEKANSSFHDSPRTQFRGVNNDKQYVADYLPNFPDEKQIQEMVNGDYTEIDSDNEDHGQGTYHEKPQLRILYEVRGKKIEDLQRLLEECKEKHGTELRVMQHKLTLMTGERDGMSMSLQQSQDLIKEERERANELKQELSEEQGQSRRLKIDNAELNEKLEFSESTIDSLNEQLTSLSHADSLSRMRSQNEMLMSTLRQKHEEEILHLKEKLDDCKKELNWKIETVNRLQDEIRSSRRLADQMKVESAETINRLSKSLEQSQRQLREILEEGELNGIGEAKYMLKRALNDKGRLEAENKELKASIQETKEQLGMYEAALDSTAHGPSSSTPFTDQNAKKKLQQFGAFKSPLSRFDNPTKLEGSPAYSIRDELIKALASNKTKRTELQDAKGKIHLLQKELESLKVKTSAAGMVDKEVMVKQSENGELIADLQSQIQNANETMERIENRRRNLENENATLKGDISQMMKDFDREKIEAMKTCEKTYTQFNEDAKKSLEERLKKEHKEEVDLLRSEMKKLQDDLTDAKESYLNLASENKALENQVRLEGEQEMEQRMKELENNLAEIRKEELEKQEQLFISKSWSQLEDERRRLKDEFNVEVKHRIETAVALAKVDWFAAYEAEKTEAIDNAVEAAKRRVTCEKESEMSQLVVQLNEKFENEKQMIKSEWQTSAKCDFEKMAGNDLANCKSRLKFSKNDRESVMEMIFKELHVDADSNLECNEIVSVIRSLKQKLNFYEEQVEKLRTEAENKENERQLKCYDETVNAVKVAKATWEKERNELMEDMLKEESQRIRKELLLDFTECDNEVDPVVEPENEEEDIYSELKDFIKYIKNVYCKKFKLLKERYESRSENWRKEQSGYLENQIEESRKMMAEKASKEKQAAQSELDDTWRKYMQEKNKEQELKYGERLGKEMEAAKIEWKRELEKLQQDHEAVLRETVSDMKSKNETEQTELKKKLNEHLNKTKKDFTDKMDKQKTDLEEYHSELTKKTLHLARKEWELRHCERDGVTPSGRSSNSISGSMDHSGTYSEERHRDRFRNWRSTNSDSGFTSPKLFPQLATPKLHGSVKYDNHAPINKEMDEECNRESGNVQIRLKSTSVQTEDAEDNSLTLQYMRKYYLETVNGIRDDVFKHVKRTKENAAVCFRKQVAKEKKLLVERIRRKCLKSLKTTDGNPIRRENEAAILQVLSDIDFEDHNCGVRSTNIGENGETSQQDRPSDKSDSVEPNGYNTRANSVAKRKGDTDLQRQISALPLEKNISRKQMSPSNSMFSCDSNGTFYTELPSALAQTPSNGGRL